MSKWISSFSIQIRHWSTNFRNTFIQFRRISIEFVSPENLLHIVTIELVRV